MRSGFTRGLAIASVILLAGCDSGSTPSPAASNTSPTRILLFTRTAAFRHDAIPDAIAAIRRSAPGVGLAIDATEDPGVFTEENLDRYAAVVFLLTTGDVLSNDQQQAFEGYIRGGGGYAGVHSASDTEYDWAWYGKLVGAVFKNHPPPQKADVIVEDAAHPATRGLPRPWTRTDEWYNFRADPRPSVHVLAWVDETTYRGGTMGEDHPWSWCHVFDGGRSWYTAGGHPRDAYADETFVQHVMGGIAWAARAEESSCGGVAN